MTTFKKWIELIDFTRSKKWIKMYKITELWCLPLKIIPLTHLFSTNDIKVVLFETWHGFRELSYIFDSSLVTNKFVCICCLDTLSGLGKPCKYFLATASCKHVCTLSALDANHKSDWQQWCQNTKVSKLTWNESRKKIENVNEMCLVEEIHN